MSQKVTNIVTGALAIALGIIVAIAGGGTALTIYFGIVTLVGGIVLLGLAVYALTKKLPLPANFVVGAGVLLTLAIALFTNNLTAGIFITIMIFVLMGAGFGLAVVGIYSLVKGAVIFGLGQIVLGALAVLFTALYLGIPDFQTAFWIIMGILIIVYGILLIVFAFVAPKSLKK